VTACERFEALLDSERQAALTADLESLVRLQDDKRALLAELAREPLSDEVIERLHARARANVASMRHLTAILRALLIAGEGEGEPGYDDRGSRRPPELRRLRGAL
jgi:hypothetical protein